MSEKTSMFKCAVCGAEIAKNAKVCPHCGGKVKKPLYKKPWFIILAIFIVICIVSCSSGGNSENSEAEVNSTVVNDVEKENTETVAEQQEEIQYTAYEVSELMNDLESNALKAESKYSEAYVELKGKLSVIDSDGKYISLVPSNNEWYGFISVQCYIKNDEQKNKVIEMSVGDIVTLRGKIKSIGEVLGYSLDIHSID